jgi:hypothetical protein
MKGDKEVMKESLEKDRSRSRSGWENKRPQSTADSKKERLRKKRRRQEDASEEEF